MARGTIRFAASEDGYSTLLLSAPTRQILTFRHREANPPSLGSHYNRKRSLHMLPAHPRK